MTTALERSEHGARFDVVHRADGTSYRRRARLTAAERAEHATIAGYGAGCRCSRCVKARRRYQRQLLAARKVLAGGHAVWKVNTGPVWRHVARLRAAGWSVPRIARAAGVAEATVWRLRRCERCWNVVSDSILVLDP